MSHDFLLEAALAEESMPISAGGPRSRRTREEAEFMRAAQAGKPVIAIEPELYVQFSQACAIKGIPESKMAETLFSNWIASLS